MSCGEKGNIEDFYEHTGYRLIKTEIDIEKEIFHSFDVNYQNLDLALVLVHL